MRRYCVPPLAAAPAVGQEARPRAELVAKRAAEVIVRVSTTGEPICPDNQDPRACKAEAADLDCVVCWMRALLREEGADRRG